MEVLRIYLSIQSSRISILLLPAGTLYAKYKNEKLMEHLKLFSTRLNIPRLIRVCQDHHHWKELVFLYVQYDEYDNAAVVMMQVTTMCILFQDACNCLLRSTKGRQLQL